MNGLVLSKKVQEKYPACKVVLLTGYKEFEYAKAAIKLVYLIILLSQLT